VVNKEMGTVLFSEKRSKQLILLGLIGIILLGAVLYSNILNAPFVFDDHSSNKENDPKGALQNHLKKYQVIDIWFCSVLPLIMQPAD